MKSSVTNSAFFSIRTHQMVACTVLMLAITGATMSARANLLVDPGFEANPLTTASNVLNFFPTYQGQWGQENATITGVDGGVTPAQGFKMLRMDNTGSYTQTFQVTDVTSYAALIDSGGSTVNMSALFNVDKNLAAALGGVGVSFFTTSTYGSNIPPYPAASMTLDNSVNTWQSISVSSAIPVGTRWLVSQVFYQDASLLGLDGNYGAGYADAADLRIVPEPSTLILLTAGLLGLLAYAWRRKHQQIVSLVAFGLLSLVAGSVSAQGINIQFDEWGNGSLNGAPLKNVPSALDPISGQSTLAYLLPFNVVRGDLILTEGAAAPPTITDIVRFDTNTTYGNVAYFFSDLPEPGETPVPLADTGIPAPWALLSVIQPELGPEGNNGAIYVTGFNNPGAAIVGGVTYSVTYGIVSDSKVPEPSTLVLLGSGLLGLLAYAWRKRASTVVSAMLVVSLFAAEASAVQYPVLDPGYTQEIYTGPLQSGEGGMAWTSGGNFLTRRGSDIIEHSLTQNTVYQGTNLHGAIATHTIAGLPASGVGMTNGLDGYVYTITGSGLYRFNPSNWAAPAQYLTSTISGAQGYGITTLPDGRIAYTDSSGSSSVWLYTPNANPLLGTNTYLTTLSGVLIDGMIAGPTGAIALAGQSNSSIVIIDNLGSIINSFSTPHYPDGLAFSGAVAASTIYSNNNDGTISKYVLGPGYTGTPTITDIATGSGAYGDLAGVGPDCGFYVSQYENGSYHGATPGVGTNWDNATTNAQASIIRIGVLGGHNGTPGEVCEFYTPYDHPVPEPSAITLLGIGIVSLLAYAWRRRRS
jgi:hypothetical protein